MTEGERDRCGSCPQRQRIKSVIASPTAVGRGNPRVLLRASPELKEDVSSFQRFTAARVLKEDASSFQRAHPVHSRLLCRLGSSQRQRRLSVAIP